MREKQPIVVRAHKYALSCVCTLREMSFVFLTLNIVTNVLICCVIWYEKSRMMGPLHCEKSLVVLAILIQYIGVTDGQTDS